MTAYPRYPLILRLIHWLVAISVIGVLTLGLTLGVLGFEGAKNTFGLPATNLIYKYHKTFGIIILGLMTLRLLIRLFVRKPPYDSPLPRVNRIASSLVHGLLYVVLLVQPVLGWAATAAGGFPIEFFNRELPKFIAKDEALSARLYDLHGAVGLLLLVLVTIHVTAALFHWLAVRDTVMRRMSLF
jgi:cytochrome b561